MKKDIINDHNLNNKTSAEQDTTTTPPSIESGELELCKKTVQELNDKYLRVSADLHNVHSRIIKERATWHHEANIKFFRDFLPIVDDFERAFVQSPQQVDNQELRAWVDGFYIIGKKINKFLQAHAVQEIDCSGEFDPHVHEAIMHIHDKEKKSGSIIEVFQKGYQINGTVIRPAKVSVAQ